MFGIDPKRLLTLYAIWGDGPVAKSIRSFVSANFGPAVVYFFLVLGIAYWPILALILIPLAILYPFAIRHFHLRQGKREEAHEVAAIVARMHAKGLEEYKPQLGRPPLKVRGK